MTSNIKKESISFQNNHEAVALSPTINDSIETITRELALKPYKTVILVIGGADNLDDKLIPKLTQLFGRSIARAAVEANAVIIDGGTEAGVMSLMGKGVADRGYHSTLIGIAPAGLVTYPNGPAADTPLEPNHSHFILTEGKSWGSETGTLFSLVNALINRTTETPQTETEAVANQKDTKKAPAIAILAGGGSVSKDEVLHAVRQNLTTIIVQGSGGLADEIAVALENKAVLPDDPVMAEIIADGDLQVHSLANSVKGMERLIIRELGVDKVLMQAWETFADYDKNANLQQKRFNQMQLSILGIGLVGTTLAIFKEIRNPGIEFSKLEFGWQIIYQFLILIPILLTIMITAANRFKQGNKWLLLRAGAEAIKREIYRYRTRSMDYKNDPEQQLSKRVEDITRRTMRTEVNSTSLIPYDKEKGYPPEMDAAKSGDDGFGYLTPDRYVELRLGDQLNYFKTKSVDLEKQLKKLSWATYIIGGIGTYLAAVNQQVWIAVTTAVVAAIGTYLGYRQTENTLTKYNQAATDLSSVKSWWNALSAEQQSDQVNIDNLVEHTEHVLQSELDGWVQQMQNALAELRKDQATKPEKEENKEPKEKPVNDKIKDNQKANAQTIRVAEVTAKDVAVKEALSKEVSSKDVPARETLSKEVPVKEAVPKEAPALFKP